MATAAMRTGPWHWPESCLHHSIPSSGAAGRRALERTVPAVRQDPNCDDKADPRFFENALPPREARVSMKCMRASCEDVHLEPCSYVGRLSLQITIEALPQ